MRTRRRSQQWIVPTAAVLTAGALSVLPILTGCADTASAADAQLERFTSCAELTRYAQEHAIESLSDPPPYATAPGVAAAREDATAAAPTAQAGDATSFSRTNVQEAGIDEPDIVKTDGSRIFAIAKGKLYAVDASGAAPRVVGSLSLPANTAPRDMLLSGNRIVLMADGQVAVREPLPATAADSDVTGQTEPAGTTTSIAPSIGTFPAPSGSVLVSVDATDPAAMRIAETFETEAVYISARLTGTTARVVLNSGAPLGVAYAYPNAPDDVAKTQAANRTALRRTTADNWIPRYSHRAADGRVSSGALAPCEAVSRPGQFAGLGTLTVLTIDLTQGVRPVDTDAVMASGENVYASGSALYVATNRWAVTRGAGPDDTTAEPTTEIHRFDTTDGAETTYAGSGSVDGMLLNQFSMSEHEGRLRVATTTDGQLVVGGDAVVEGPNRQSESAVSILEPSGDKLVLTGRVAGLGKGERIYSVRFIGNRGYVVTFRQTDPLYSLDLSDPANPRVTGELKINGYSAYLHPIAENLLIGVGQDATNEGRVTGTQVSLFDVSDPAAPRRLQQFQLPGAYSEAEWDHHAFLWWPDSSLAMLPIQITTQGAPTPTGEIPYAVTSSALGLRVTPEGIAEVGRVTQPADPNQGQGIRRSLVVGDTVFTLSETGLTASGLTDLAQRSWIPFP
jgi:hypothetical protein